MTRDLRTAEVPPHCDSRILHAPGECEFCDGRPEWQALRQAWGIAFTGHEPDGGWITMPCPADAARPRGSRADHRRWGGNTATSRRGDPAQPRQTLASVMMYGDQGARGAWPLPERVVNRVVRRPLDRLWHWRRGWRREGPFWVLRSRP